MALQPIPNAWRRKVAGILRRGTSSEIRRTADYSDKLDKSFPDVFESRVTAAFLQFLEGPNPQGCPVQMDRPAGETWEFWFTLKGKQTYGKILLRTDQQRIVLFSAHLPQKDKLRCE
ncbi:MAG: hypothetical protein EA353_06255 [Puniceicoccaceae bacterium]|nr:MAG: hypothetical protein EA353_06255 [Puniceicoccaceae bacterium]